MNSPFSGLKGEREWAPVSDIGWFINAGPWLSMEDLKSLVQR